MGIRDTLISRTLDRVAVQMQLDFQQAGETSHRLSSGALREDQVVRFLNDYLPSTVKVTGTGELISLDGQASGQCDVLVVDSATPPLWSAPNYRTVPIECCVAAVEVKSNLTTAELKKAWAAANRIKKLPRSAYVETPFSAPISNTACPQYHVFGFNGAGLELLAKTMADLSRDTEPGMGIDSLCVLDAGFVTWVDLATQNFGKQTATSAAAPYSDTPGNALMFLLAFLSAQLEIWTLNPKLDLRKYINGKLGKLTGGGIYLPTPSGAALYPVKNGETQD